MYSQSILWDIMRLEMFLGPSDECHSCGAIFLAHSDGCPTCGSYRTSKLHPMETEREEWDMETFPVEVWDMDKFGFEVVNVSDASLYPRAEV